MTMRIGITIHMEFIVGQGFGLMEYKGIIIF